MSDIDKTINSSETSNPIEERLETLAGLNDFLDHLEPLLAGGRLNSVLEILSLLSDIVDLSDNAMIEKLSSVLESVTKISWEVGNATTMAHTEMSIAEQEEHIKYSLRSVYLLARDEDTLRGLTLLLRTIQIIGARISAIKEVPLITK